MNEIKKIVGAQILAIEGCVNGSDEVVISTNKGILRLMHQQDCCERVYLEDFNGDPSDLICADVMVAEERQNNEGDEYGITRWTFYTIRTTRGDLDLRWYGSSNGYYSVEVDAQWTPIDPV